jgi:beta-lactam-binding protein with PASTA domain/tetratricopeptide (TPR) repeat protein
VRASDAVRPGARGAVLLAVALCCPGRVVPARAPDAACSPGAGRIDGILVANESRNAVERTQMAVARDGEAVGARNGMPLCVGDVVTTGASVKGHLRLDSVPDAEKWITLDPESYIQIVDGNSLFFRLGRLFASLRGRFEVQTPFARLGARGTEFQVEARADGVDVVQLEGAVDVTPGTGAFPQADSLDPVPRVLLVGWPAGQRDVAPARPPPQGAALQLDRLTRLTIGPQQGMRIVAADRNEVARTVDANCAAIIATRPASPSQSFIRLFESPEARATAYRTARVAATLTPDPEQFAKLARAYTDFGEARRAVRAFEMAGDPAGSGRDLAIRLNEIGNAYRLKGDLAAAEATYRRALAADPVFAFPYNGLGDVYRDQALAALDRGETDAGEGLLLKARELYDHSLDPSLWGKEGGPNRAVPFYNMGVVWLQIAQVKAAERANVQQTEYYLGKGEDDFRRALAASPGYAFAEVGVGRVFVARAALYSEAGRRDLYGENVERARLHLERVAERYPSFAVARQALGEVLELANDPAAPGEFLRATELDPSYPLAYFRLARALQRSARPDAARLYYQAYLRIESPVFRGGERYATATAGAGLDRPGGAGPGPAPLPPPAPAQVVVPALAGMSQADAVAALAAARLAVGNVGTRSGTGRAGTVIDQSVRPGTRVPPGSTIDLVVATSGRTVKVPDVVGDVREKVVRKLREKNLQAGRVTARPSCEDAGEVVAQNPPEDERVLEGTSVDLVIASTGEGIPVPKVTDLSQADAERMLRARGLVVKRVRQQETGRRPPGTVIGQQPKPNTLLAQGCPVDLQVAVPVPTVRVPSFVGTTERDARRQLPSGAGALFGDFRLGTITYQDTRDAAAGTVIAQDPRPGTEVPARSAAPVNLIVATAPSGSGDSGKGGVRPSPGDRDLSSRLSVTVPDVRNKTLEIARRMLSDAGLKYTVVRGDSDTVREQSPEPGASVRRGSTVNLTMHYVIK